MIDVFEKDLYTIIEYCNKTFEWLSTDSKEAYEQNLHIMNPVYADKKITYEHNEYGHRSPTVIEKLPSRDYFIAFGCSHTYGLGLPTEHTWPSMLSEFLGMPYYNAACSSLGIDCILAITEKFVHKSSTNPPRFVVVQCPEMSRKYELLFRDEEQGGPRYELKNNNSLLREDIKKQIENNDYTLAYNAAQYVDLIASLWGQINIPVLFFSYNEECTDANLFSRNSVINFPSDSFFQDIYWDLARDNQHSGVCVNTALSRELYKYAKEIVDAYHSGFYNNNILTESVKHKNTLPDFINVSWVQDFLDSQRFLHAPEEQRKTEIKKRRERSNFIYR